MKVLASEKFIEDTVLLTEGEDYQKSHLRGNAFVGDRLKELKPDVARAIAKKNGYDHWTWMGHEENGFIVVKFRKDIK